MAFIHPLVILAAVLCGVYTGLMGWKRFQYKRGRAPASAFPWQRHIRWGRMFFILLWIGSLIGLGYMIVEIGTTFSTGFHAYLAIIIIILFSVGVGIGIVLSKGKRTDRRALIHMVVNYSALLLVALQIALGLILLSFFL